MIMIQYSDSIHPEPHQQSSNLKNEGYKIGKKEGKGNTKQGRTRMKYKKRTRRKYKIGKNKKEIQNKEEQEGNTK